MRQRRYRIRPEARTGVFAILAILAAGGGIVASCAGYWGWGLLLAVAAIPLALAGFLHSVAPEIRGGPLSLVALVLGGLGIVIGLIAMLYWLVTVTA